MGSVGFTRRWCCSASVGCSQLLFMGCAIWKFMIYSFWLGVEGLGPAVTLQPTPRSRFSFAADFGVLVWVLGLSQRAQYPFIKDCPLESRFVPSGFWFWDLSAGSLLKPSNPVRPKPAQLGKLGPSPQISTLISQILVVKDTHWAPIAMGFKKRY